ncbi:MAG: peroxiredoxin [Piscirickettsiaceae bacterium]|nr:peroxiredoxin [Piscirickettsiaceae bacterium]
MKLGLLIIMLSIFNTVQADNLKVGDTAPELNLRDQTGKLHTINDYAGQWLVLYFYPKDNTPGCIKEACEFRDEYRVIKEKNTQVLGVSIDSQESHAEFAEKYHLPFPLLADKNGKVAQSYQSLFSFWPMKFAKRHSFIIDPKGVIRKIYRKVDVDSHSKTIIVDIKLLRGGSDLN